MVHALVDATACPRGHATTPANLYVGRDGWTRCRPCRREATDAYTLAHPRPRVARPVGPPWQQRFWAKVDTSAGLFECWPWQGARNDKGYGHLSIDGRDRIAPRLSLEIATGPIPDGLHVLHSCDNPPCVNPAHLRSGTRSDNMRDMVARGRATQNLRRVDSASRCARGGARGTATAVG